MEKWNIEDLKKFTREKVDKCYHVSPSAIVLMSFYIGEIDKPKEITIRMFDWLRSIVEQDINIYKSHLNKK